MRLPIKIKDVRKKLLSVMWGHNPPTWPSGLQVDEEKERMIIGLEGNYDKTWTSPKEDVGVNRCSRWQCRISEEDLSPLGSQKIYISTIWLGWQKEDWRNFNVGPRPEAYINRRIVVWRSEKSVNQRHEKRAWRLNPSKFFLNKNNDKEVET